MFPELQAIPRDSLGSPREPDLAEDRVAETLLHDTPHRESFGSVRGSVDKPSQGHTAPFAVYPHENPRGIACYVTGEDAARLAKLRHKRVRVEGLLRHDSSSGLPESIRPVTNIVVLEPPATASEVLWGILPTVDAVPARRECLARGFPWPALVDAPRMTTDT